MNIVARFANDESGSTTIGYVFMATLIAAGIVAVWFTISWAELLKKAS